MKNTADTRQLFAAFAVSALIHAAVLVLVPAVRSRLDSPLLSTVMVELLERNPGAPEPTLQTAPSGDQAKPTQAGERMEAQNPEQPERAAEAGRGAPQNAKPEPKRAFLKKSEERLSLDKVPESREQPLESLDEPPDPVFGAISEATLRLEETDRRYQGFLGAVRSAVNNQWNSRDAMIAAQRSGTATLGFTLRATGGVALKVEILKSSESHALDSEALRAVGAAAFPPFPSHWKLERLHLVGQFVYSFTSGD